MKEMVKVNETRAGGEKKGILSRFQEDGFLKAIIALVFFEVLHQLLKILLPLVGVDWGLNNSGAVVREIILKVIPVVILSIVFKTSDVLKNTKNFGSTSVCVRG